MQQLTILYLPGHGGRFLERLFSLHATVAPILTPEQHQTYYNDRLSLYSFSKYTEYRSWLQFHNEVHDRASVLDDPIYNFSITAAHPGDLLDTTGTRLIAVNLTYSPFNNFWMHAFHMHNNFAPTIRVQDIVNYSNFKDSAEITLTLDSFLLETGWEDEYYKICNHVGIPTDIDLAKQLHSSWHSARVIPYAEMFKQIDQIEYATYNDLRANRERLGDEFFRDNYALLEYNMLRGDSWPVIYSINELQAVPEFVKDELLLTNSYTFRKYFVM